MAGIGPGRNGGKLARTYTEDEIIAGLMAVIAWAGNATAAARYLKAEKGIDLNAATLNSWKTVHAARYAEMREQYASQKETELAHEFRDVAMLAVVGERLAIEKATARLKAGKDEDPGRTAANLARVAQSSTDKLMTVTSRPTQITENRGLQEILRSLGAMGVFKGFRDGGDEIPEVTEEPSETVDDHVPTEGNLCQTTPPVSDGEAPTPTSPSSSNGSTE